MGQRGGSAAPQPWLPCADPHAVKISVSNADLRKTYSKGHQVVLLSKEPPHCYSQP